MVTVSLEYYKHEGIPHRTPVLVGLASGQDVALSILEASLGPFESLSPGAVELLTGYFLRESVITKRESIEVAIWYKSYAEAIEQLFPIETG